MHKCQTSVYLALHPAATHKSRIVMRKCLCSSFKDPSEAEEETQEKQPTEKPNAKTKPAKRKKETEKAVKAKKKKTSQQVIGEDVILSD